MGRERTDPNVHSSIALLQERFRQLQKVKEMREERELLRLFAQAEHAIPAARYKPSASVAHPDLILPARHIQGTCFLQADSQGKHTDFRDNNSLLSMTLWTDRPVKHSSDNFDMDVDTSLHL